MDVRFSIRGFIFSCGIAVSIGRSSIAVVLLDWISASIFVICSYRSMDGEDSSM